jgi:hypothetical protein
MSHGAALRSRDPFVLPLNSGCNGLLRRGVSLPRAAIKLTWRLAILAAIAGGCRFAPSNDREWAPEVSRLATADIQGDSVVVHNVRNCTYRTERDFDVHYEDRRYDLNKLNVVDYILVPFSDMRASRTRFSASASATRTMYRSRSSRGGCMARFTRQFATSSIKARSSTSSATNGT